MCVDLKRKHEKHNPSWPQNLHHLCKILIIGSPGSGKANTLISLIDRQSDIDKIYLYARDPYEAKHHFIIDKREGSGIKAVKFLLNI